MNWFNYYGLGIMTIIMIPNIIFAIKNEDGFKNAYRNIPVEAAEQISRYACFALMIFNIPYTYYGFYFPFAKEVYICVNFTLTFAYCMLWLILRKKSDILKAISLSVIPSVIFIFSGIMTASIPLLLFSIIFAVAHIFISIKNALPLSK